MARFENKQGITGIELEKVIHNYCPLGEDWYTNNVSIQVIPGDVIPDYIEIDREIENKIEGKTLSIEDVVSLVSETFMEYKPKYINVVSDVQDAKHLHVKVAKEYIKE